MFTKALAPFVNVRTRAKGLQYFSSGRVIDITGGEWVANAVVRGTRDYRVELVRDSEPVHRVVRVPVLRRSGGDLQTHLGGAARGRASGNCLAATARLVTMRSSSPSTGRARLTFSSRPRSVTRVPASGQRGQAPAVAALPPRTPAGRRRRRRRAVPLPRFSNGEIVYAIDVRETLAGRGTVVSVLFRQRRKNGAWTKPKPRRRHPGRSRAHGRS